MKLNSIIHIVRLFLKKLDMDNIAAFSAQAALFTIISFFPFVMFLLTLIHYLPITESSLLTILMSIMPPVFKGYIITIVQEIYNKSSGTLISITVITALWSASRGFLAITRGLNYVYGIAETRNFLKLRITSTLYTFVFAVLLIASLGFLVFGNSIYIWIGNKFPHLNNLALLIISIRTIAGLLLLSIYFLLLFLFVPNRKSAILAELPGTVITATGWMGFSYLYSFYIDNFAKSSHIMYGSLTAIVLLMLWLYSCMYIMFIGAEANILLQTVTDARAEKKLLVVNKFH